MNRYLAPLAALALATAALAGPLASPAAATNPCWMETNGAFSAAEFSNWYDGARWGDSLDHVEGTYVGCAGLWENVPDGDWNGHYTKYRTWPRSDGGYTEIVFAHYDNAPQWRAHDNATTENLNVGGTSWRHECEWHRDGNDPCTPSQ
jgi:hypothetical protein